MANSLASNQQRSETSLYLLSPFLFNLYAEYTVGEAGLGEDEHNFKILDAIMCLYLHWQ